MCVSNNSCACFAGFSGALCETANTSSCFGISPETNGVCSGFGVCVGPDNCQCYSHHSNFNCQNNDWQCFFEDNTTPFVCSTHGTCTSQDICDCDAGFAGERCGQVITNVECGIFDLSASDPAVCSARGYCTANGCVCNENFGGFECESVISCNGIDAFESNVCSGVGSCTAQDSCQGFTGFTGQFCQTHN